MRMFFGFDKASKYLASPINVHPSRSPFMKEKIAVYVESKSIEELWTKIKGFEVPETKTYKVVFVNLDKGDKLSFKERRNIERQAGLLLNGRVDLKEPMVEFGIMNVNGRWVFGELERSEAVWYKHQMKPHQYSTALSTRVARAVVNIAVPNPIGVKVIDPCCGIGTVLVEALSMGIDIVGSDINFQVLPGTRENIAYFGFHTDVTLCDIRDVTEFYNVAIIDMPYNLCSVLPTEEKMEMLQSARNIADKVVIVTVEPLEEILEEVGLHIVDRCVAKKSSFTRQVIVCT
ncbi:RNA methyltransferase [Anaerobacillus alkaliphilus]|uniref:RNA methyltransferase n=2 Tax=Anaerobacillus alkaliphilus TaxID=1548597 RepID=A0A4Q0W257_9BACI|nr:RNA methyltransferase [Anaerobacillus alkaliphilus]